MTLLPGRPLSAAGTLTAMHHADAASWRFAEGCEQLLLVALFVRDAADLPVPAGDLIPPRLDGEVPDRSTHLDPVRRAAAGSAWSGWWSAVVAQAVRAQQGAPADVDQRAWLRERAAEHQRVFDPPEFASLADRPALRDVVLATFADGLRWADRRRRVLLFPTGGLPGQFDYQVARAVAEQIARQHRVSPGEVRGCAIVLPVERIWWHRVEPGAVLCSVDAARDPTTARTILADAFESGMPS